MSPYLLRSLAFIAFLTLCTPVQAAPKVVVSIKPLQSLAARIMTGLGAPVVVVSGSASPHSYSLRPSDMRALQEADVVFWIGPSFETFLTQPLAATRATAVSLAAAPGIAPLRGRAGGLWDTSPQAPDTGVDPHLWLDVANAQAIAQAMAAALGAADAANAARYTANARTLQVDLEALDTEIRATLAPVRDRAFIVFHDATHYFEARYGLKGVGAVSISPERPPGARRVEGLRARVSQGDIACIFTEPQFEPKLLSAITARARVKTGILDPEGAALTPGPTLYFDLMRGLARGFAQCLASP